MKTLAQYTLHVQILTGTKATTAKGLVNSWRNWRKAHPENRLFSHQSPPNGYASDLKKASWKKAVAARKADPESKRAKVDAKFRKNWIKRLHREAARLTRPATCTQSYLAQAVNTPKLENVNAALAKLGAKALPAPALPKSHLLPLPLSLTTKQKKEIRAQIGGSALDTAQWYFRAGTLPQVARHVWNESTKKNGSWRTVTTADHKIDYQSFGLILENGKIWETCILGTVTRHAAPEGHTIQADNLGLKLVRDSDGRDWHPHNPESTTPQQWAEALTKADTERDAAEARKLATEKHRALFLADAKTTRVHLADSRRAGNCAAGSIAFGDRLGLKTEDYNGLNSPGVSGAMLLRTHDPRAEKAVLAAWERETLVQI